MDKKRKSDCFRVLLRGVDEDSAGSGADERWRLCMSTPGVANPRGRPRFSRVQSPQISQLRRHLCTSQSRAHFLPRPWLSCREGSADPSSRPAPAARGQLASQPSGRWIAQLLATRSSTLETLQLCSHVVAKRKCRKSDTKFLDFASTVNLTMRPGDPLHRQNGDQRRQVWSSEETAEDNDIRETAAA